MAKGLVMLPYMGNNPSSATITSSGKVSVSTNPTRYYGAVSGILDGNAVPINCYYARYSTNQNNIYIANITGLSNQNTANYAIVYATIGSTIVSRQQLNSEYYYAGYHFAYYGASSGTLFEIKEWFDKGFEWYSSLNEVCQAILENSPQDVVNIRYKGNNAILAGPSYVSIGSSVNVYVTTQPGVAVAQSDIVVVKGDTQIPFTYSNNQITFTAQ